MWIYLVFKLERNLLPEDMKSLATVTVLLAAENLSKFEPLSGICPVRIGCGPATVWLPSTWFGMTIQVRVYQAVKALCLGHGGL